VVGAGSKPTPTKDLIYGFTLRSKFNLKAVIICRVLKMSKITGVFVTALLITLITASCKSGSTAEETQPAVEASEPTPTEAPMAARVNGEGVLLSDYEQELQRYQAAAGNAGGGTIPPEPDAVVIDELINQLLLSQAAAQEGFVLDDASLQSRYDELADQRGGAESLNQWISDNFYSQESFRRALARDMSAVWMRNRILESVPTTADQVHARQVLVRSENEAIAVERRLQVGTDFTTIAYEYDPLTGGELGWFPAGYLLQPDVEAAAFSLQPGQFSGIIPTSYGFHVLFVIERDPNHPLSGEALLFKQREVLVQWLAERRAQSSIEIYID
jgi:peptidyl-prolyl cis-trans isomerase C